MKIKGTTITTKIVNYANIMSEIGIFLRDYNDLILLHLTFASQFIQFLPNAYHV